jgi:hypothetical protein
MHNGDGVCSRPHGYVVQNGEIAEVYKSGDMDPYGESGIHCLLKVTKGYFNDPEYDNDLTAFLKLPAAATRIYIGQSMKWKAASPKECGFASRGLRDPPADGENN